ncbi:MAG: sialate O-acetylesterase [Verrucomicrobiota bacterium]
MAFDVCAHLKLPALFTDHMVLQQGQPVPVWGWADAGEKVTVQFGKQKVTTTAGPDGKWMVRLKKLKASASPATLKVSGHDTIEIQDVLVGEVWIASGQSNMEWALRITHEPQQAIANAANPHLRLFTVPKLKANEPMPDIKSSWVECNSQSVSNFSAVAYYFARDLQKALRVPVGIIHTSWGGSPAEVWMSRDVLEKNPDYKGAILDTYAAAFAKYEQAKASFEKEQADLKAQGKTSDKRPPGAPYWKPTELYNGMIAPLIPYAIQGAIWYQGESNAGRAHQYRTLFPDMIRNWRRDWGQGDFTFLAVQLAPFTAIKDQPGDSDWAELREAQALATKVLPKVGMAVITDVGDEKDIHPRKKEPVGARLALAARGIAYGEKITYCGPCYRSMQIRGNQAVLHFDHVGRGLEARGGELKGFAIAGADQKFVWAKAEIQGKTVVVSSSEISNPVAVRFGWANYPVVNLWNLDGLPASPFRTDDFPMITAPKTVSAAAATK